MAWSERNIPPHNLKIFQISGSIKENVFSVTGTFSVKRMTAIGNLRLDYESVYIWLPLSWLPRWQSGKEFSCQYRRYRKHGFNPWVRKMPWSGKWQPIPVLLPGKFHGQSLSYYIHGIMKSWTQLSMHECIHICNDTDSFL